jgi:endoglucanase
MRHFYEDHDFNVFRLPVGWQWLTNHVLGGPLHQDNFSKYHQLVTECLNIAPHIKCVIDIHNYARWDQGIIGQGGPTNEQFASLWRHLATFYRDEPRIIFGVSTFLPQIIRQC